MLSSTERNNGLITRMKLADCQALYSNSFGTPYIVVSTLAERNWKRIPTGISFLNTGGYIDSWAQGRNCKIVSDTG